MAQFGGIIGLAPWLKTPPGRYLLAWEQAQVDRCVADIFGFHALQLGLPELDALRANRMPHRWQAVDHLQAAEMESCADGEVPAPRAVMLHCDFDALPFDSQSLDLVVLPHALERARDPHQALREVERVLVPEGKIVILGFNPGGLWALRQSMGRVLRGLGLARGRPLFMPSEGELLGYWRLRDWLRLLSFDIEEGRFGCYRPPFVSEPWLARFEWMDRTGSRWWPVLGAAYMLVAVKRVRGMRLVGLVRHKRVAAKAAPAVVRRTTTTTTSQQHDIDAFIE
ncbi:class I SAM-dependent methyltransferase [Rhizobacter sp. J219]|uniref:class I SAM-dependent methyltransferase n=1 Tax=Rhizobacter sp. J219 TaxID=2898430 RepID=UPI00215174A7|nr:class I SAM-dependent methyltransferase [Rhizobacter sp. J219]MCR5882638.1 class I SAM-dependent methyltransferase [Rhizobacter sp. J219]